MAREVNQCCLPLFSAMFVAVRLTSVFCPFLAMVVAREVNQCFLPLFSAMVVAVILNQMFQSMGRTSSLWIEHPVYGENTQSLGLQFMDRTPRTHRIIHWCRIIAMFEGRSSHVS